MTGCPFRVMCEGMRQVCCHPAKRDVMAGAIASCGGAECFAIFGERMRAAAARSGSVSDEQEGA